MTPIRTFLKSTLLAYFPKLARTVSYSKSNKNPSTNLIKTVQLLFNAYGLPPGLFLNALCFSLPLSQQLCSPVPQLEQLPTDCGPRTPHGQPGSKMDHLKRSCRPMSGCVVLKTCKQASEHFFVLVRGKEELASF